MKYRLVPLLKMVLRSLLFYGGFFAIESGIFYYCFAVVDNPRHPLMLLGLILAFALLLSLKAFRRFSSGLYERDINEICYRLGIEKLPPVPAALHIVAFILLVVAIFAIVALVSSRTSPVSSPEPTSSTRSSSIFSTYVESGFNSGLHMDVSVAPITPTPAPASTTSSSPYGVHGNYSFTRPTPMDTPTPAPTMSNEEKLRELTKEANRRLSDRASKPSATQAPASQSSTTRYIGNSNTKVFHYPSCPSVDQMKESNKVSLSSRSQAISAGYRSCGRCNP